MRTLAVLSKSPVPPDNGGRQRLVHLLAALHERGAVDVLIGQPITADERELILGTFPGGRVFAPDEPVPHHARGRVRWLTARDLPLGPGLLDPRAIRREARTFAAIGGARHDLVFAAGAAAMWLLGRTIRGVPVVMDCADVTSVLHARESDVLRAAGPRSASAVKDLVRHRVEAARWAKFERTQGAKASLLTVCSPTDRELLGVPGAVVVPNGACRPDRPAAELRTVEPRATLVFPGQMTYAPNIDGARWFVDEVLPHLRRLVPHVEVEIVGRPAPEVEALAAVEGVHVRGYVPRMNQALAAATAVIVPLRQGSGTRIKIIEAWANHLPVVSTTVGAEGLGVVDGDDILLGDDPSSFAAACARVLDDASLRRRLVARGAARYDDELDWRSISARFGALVDTVADGAFQAAG